MGSFFRFDGPFFKYGTILADLFILTILWALFSIPIITIGPSTAALYYVTTKQVSNREGYPTTDFFKAFRMNFKQGVIVTVLYLAFFALVYVNSKMLIVVENEMMRAFIWGLQWVLGIEAVALGVYLFPLMSRFEMSLLELFKTSMFMANRHMFTTITCVFLFIALILLGTLINPIFVFVCMGIYSYVTAYMIVRIFRKYHVNFDLDEGDAGYKEQNERK